MKRVAAALTAGFLAFACGGSDDDGGTEADRRGIGALEFVCRQLDVAWTEAPGHGGVADVTGQHAVAGRRLDES